ncbi:MAG: F420-0:Gamma-glutamyl ligase [Candidatus Eremiobacter antarcticus]|nr:coenzyme F420-0:L-glutamate ligase [Candidatus Eremiobacteraeota bacterium]MBC5808349.1 coenzyme F420-0:L-glutamate ligase [Candidatus Eremiobacteraeota bacterium]PZR63717.1 MAG: F420-0:Gamma-glutamyl ligase [Candidatus Eremiobacter sp. RRmetagenome_bin22]
MSLRSFTLELETLPKHIVAIPVRTPLIKEGDDLAAIVSESLHGMISSADVVCVSETAVAIAQGRSIRAEAIRPGRLARMLSQRAGSYATVNQPESMQLVLENAGVWKVLTAAAAGAAGRLIGRRGDFYRILGSEVAEVDGYTGTMPPYERHIVLGPQDPAGVAEAIALACAANACIVDANDLGKAQILGASAAVDQTAVRLCLLCNPAGNADEQTPVVVLKYRPQRGSPALSPLVGQP